jgi:hypothetical protein
MNDENVHLELANGMYHKTDVQHGPNYDVHYHPVNRGGSGKDQTPFRIRETGIWSYEVFHVAT